MDLSDDGFEVLLQHLTPADTAALRSVSRSWQALVDRCLTTLQPFEVTTGFFSLNGTPCLTYRSPFRHSSVRHHPLEFGPSYALHAIAGQFTALHSLSVDCGSKACGDFEALPLMKHLRQLHLAQFSFADEAFQKGVGLCRSLVTLHLDGQQAFLCMLSLRHLTGLSRLQELVLRPRGYTHQPLEYSQGVAALSMLTSLTQLALLTALKPPRHTVSGESSALAGPMPDAFPGPGGVGAAGGEGQSPYLTAAATLKLSDALGGLTNLKVLHLTGVAFLPPVVLRLRQLVELSLLRVAWVDRPAVASLRALSQLTSLTLITAADAPELLDAAADAAALHHEQQQQHAAQHAGQPMQHVDGEHAHLPAAGAGAAGAGGAEAAAAGPYAAAAVSGHGLWMPLLELPSLQHLVLGSAHLSQQLNLTGDLHASLATPQRSPANSFDSGSGAQGACGSSSAGGSGCSSSRSWRGAGWCQEASEAVSAYVCPTGAWSDIAGVKGLQHMVVVRSWHSAAVTAVFPSFAAAVAAFMSWPPTPPVPASAALHPAPPPSACGAAAAVLPQATVTSAAAGQMAVASLLTPGVLQSAAVTPAPAAGSQGVVAPDGSVGVFYNHPNQGCYIPAMPQLLVLAFRPSVGRLGVQHKALVSQLLQLVARQQGGQAAGGQQQPVPAQGFGGWRGHADSVARCLLLAQLRASMHHSRLLLVLGASATHLTRLELTVDQSWPPTVLASLGQLDRLQGLSVLKLDCGRQQPVDEMWEGLSRLVGLRWLCLRWLERLPVAHLAPLTNLVALQLKNIDKPPGVAQLAEVLHGMPHLTALAIEGALLDADEDWLRDMVGLMRHGRWTSSWVEHILCREYHLRVLGSITAALLMSTLLNSTRWPEMLASALLAAVAGAMFVMSVAASLLRLLLDPHHAQQRRRTHQQEQLKQQGVGRPVQRLVQECGGGAAAQQQQQNDVGASLFEAASAAAAAAGAAVGAQRGVGSLVWSTAAYAVSACVVVARFGLWLLGGWLLTAAPCCSSLLPDPASTATTNDATAAASSSGSSSSNGGGGGGEEKNTWLSFVLQLAAVRASFAKGMAPSLQDTRGVGSTPAPVPSPGPAGVAPGPGFGPAPAPAPAAGSHSVSHHAAAPPPFGGAGAGAASGASASGSQDNAQHSSSSSSSGTMPTSGSTISTTTSSSSSSTASSSSSSITDPGSAFRRLRLLSLRRCTLTHSNSSVSNKLWQLSVLASQLAPGLGAQLVAVGLALVFWPLAVLAAISRIVATSGSFYSYGSSSGVISSSGSSGGGGSSGGSYSYSRRSRFAVWAWGWDLLCGLLQGAANRVEGVAAGCGPVVAVASCMPELRFLDLTWLNLEPWELHSIVQMKQLHYLGLSRQQVGVVMSPEAVFARNCTRGRGRARGYTHRHTAEAAAAAGQPAGQQQEMGMRGQGFAPSGGRFVWGWMSSLVAWILAPLWYFFFLPIVTPRFVWPVKGLWGGWRGGGSSSSRWKRQQEQVNGVGGSRGPAVGVPGVEMLGMFEEWPSLMLIESPSGFDEAIEREFAAV